MIIENLKNALTSLQNLSDTAELLCDSLMNSYDNDDINDWVTLERYQEKIFTCVNLLFCEQTVVNITLIFVKNSTSIDEETRFTFQKEINSFYQDRLIAFIKGIIRTCKSWKFTDYRCINFQQEVKEIMEALLDFQTKSLSYTNTLISNVK